MGAGQLPAELDQPAVGEGGLDYPTAWAVARLEHHHVRPSGCQVTGSAEPCETCPDDYRVRHGPFGTADG